jgi:hypothetical protein
MRDALLAWPNALARVYFVSRSNPFSIIASRVSNFGYCLNDTGILQVNIWCFGHLAMIKYKNDLRKFRPRNRRACPNFMFTHWILLCSFFYATGPLRVLVCTFTGAEGFLQEQLLAKASLSHPHIHSLSARCLAWIVSPVRAFNSCSSFPTARLLLIFDIMLYTHMVRVGPNRTWDFYIMYNYCIWPYIRCIFLYTVRSRSVRDHTLK